MNINEELPLDFREALDSDMNYLFGSWLQSYRVEAIPNLMRTTIYYHEQHRVVKRLLERAKIMVAVNENDSDQIFGFLCYEKIPEFFVIHYCHVKEPFRRLGIAKELFKRATVPLKNEDPLIYTHHTKMGRMIADRIKADFNPYWAF